MSENNGTENYLNIHDNAFMVPLNVTGATQNDGIKMNDEQKFPFDRGKDIFKNFCLDMGRVLILCNFVKVMFNESGEWKQERYISTSETGNYHDLDRLLLIVEEKTYIVGNKIQVVNDYKRDHAHHVYNVQTCHFIVLGSYCVKELLNFVHIDGSIAYIFDVMIVPTNGE